MKLLQELATLNEAAGFKPGDKLPANPEAVMDAFIGFAIDKKLTKAKHRRDPDAGVDHLTNELEQWLEDGDTEYDDSVVDKWMEKHETFIYEFLYDGLT